MVKIWGTLKSYCAKACYLYKNLTYIYPKFLAANFSFIVRLHEDMNALEI